MELLATQVMELLSTLPTILANNSVAQASTVVNTQNWSNRREIKNNVLFASPKNISIKYNDIEEESVIYSQHYSINIKVEPLSDKDVYFQDFDIFSHESYEAYALEVFNNKLYIVKNVYLKVSDNKYLYIVYKTSSSYEPEVLEIIQSIKVDE